jgi:hypothetical protein
VTNDLEGWQQRWLSREEVLQALDEIAVSPVFRSVSEILGRQRDLLYNADAEQMAVYLISDFQQSMCDLEQVTHDSLLSVWFVPLSAAKKENLFIDSCWFDSPVHQLGQSVKLVVRVGNQSESDFEKVPLKLTVNDQQKAVASIDIPQGGHVDVVLPFTNYQPGIQYATLEISDYPITFDDRLYFSFEVAGSIPVLSINEQEESRYLGALFSNDSAFTFLNNAYSNIDYDRLQDFNLVILNELRSVSSGLSQELTTFLGNGGTLLVIPSKEMDMLAFQQFCANAGVNSYIEWVNEDTRVSGIDTRNPVFTDVFERRSPGTRTEWDNTDWPSVRGYFKISAGNQTRQLGIMTLLNGGNFLTLEQPQSGGKVYLLAVPLDESFSNFASHAIFVPAIHRIALLSAATTPLYYTIGSDDQMSFYSPDLTGDRTLKISALSGDFEFIPGHISQNRKLNLHFNDQVKLAGHYRLMNGNEPLKGIAFDYSRKESVMEFLDAGQLQQLTERFLPGNSWIIADKGKPVSETIKEMNQGTSLWKLFIILALIFLGFEILLLRFWNIGR